MKLASMVAGIVEELRRKGNTPADKVLRVAQRGIWSIKSPNVNLGKVIVVDLRSPPEASHGMADLLVRRAELADVPALSAVDGSDPAIFQRRLADEDLGYVGQLDDEILCYTWFHRGPRPFEEDRGKFAPLDLEESTFWSYDAMTRPDVRSSGIFPKVFRHALRDIFHVHGAKRILGSIDHINDASLGVHKRLGFRTIGSVTSLVVPGFKWLRWEAGGAPLRQRVLRRQSDFVLYFPAT
jgi:hypothetical protein